MPSSRVEIGTTWNKIVDTKKKGQPASATDIGQLTDLLTQNPKALEEILRGNHNGNRQEPK